MSSHTGSGRIFLIGDRPNIKAVLSEPSVGSPVIEDHPVMILVGGTRLWIRWSRYGCSAPEQISGQA